VVAPAPGWCPWSGSPLRAANPLPRRWSLPKSVALILSRGKGFGPRLRGAGGPANPRPPRPPVSSPNDGRILLAKSPEQNPCGKICSQHGAKLDENRTSTLTNSTTIQSIGSVCRLVVISPTDPPRAGAHHRGKKVRAACPPRIFAAVSGRSRGSAAAGLGAAHHLAHRRQLGARLALETPRQALRQVRATAGPQLGRPEFVRIA
jgi:hypothetical protein